MDEKLCKILIVDDNKDIHEDIKYILDSSFSGMEDYQETRLLKEELFGDDSAARKNEIFVDVKYRIEDAYQGDEAMSMVMAAKESGDPYSMIFMDVRMPPGIDGIRAIECIWKIDPDVGFVICTAYSDYSWDQIISKLGQNDNLLFIRKPFDSISLKQVALAMTTKWSLKKQVNEYIGNLEQQVGKRTKELTAVIEQLKTEIALRKEKEKLLAYSAHYDYLTGLLNRRSFYSSTSIMEREDQFHCDGFSLFYIDIDGFKNVNDIFGHDIGDKLLTEVAKRTGAMLDTHACIISDFIDDIGNVKAIFRLGGDEFTAIINAVDRHKIGRIAQNLIDSIKEPFLLSGHEINITCCVGISICPHDDTTMEILLKYADIALYEAKKNLGEYRFFAAD